MPLDTQPIEIILSGGINSSIDEKLLPQNSLLELTNGYYTKYGQISKRPGFSYVTDQGMKTTGGTVDLVTPKNLYQHNTEVLADIVDEFESRRLYSYSPSLYQWVQKDKVSEVAIEKHSIARAQALADEATVGYTDNFLLYVWQDATNLRAELVDSVTRATIRTWSTLTVDFSLVNYCHPQIMIFDHKFYVFYTVNDGGDNYIYFRFLDTDAISQDFSTETPVQNLGSYTAWAIDTAGLGNFVIAYGSIVADGYAGLTIAKRTVVSPMDNVYSYQDLAPTAEVTYLAITGPANTAAPTHTFVAWANNTPGARQVYIRELNEAMTTSHGYQIGTPTTTIRGVDLFVYSANNVLVSYILDQTYTEPATFWESFNFVNSTPSAFLGCLYNVSQHSRIFKGPNDGYYFIGHTMGALPATLSFPDSSYVLVDLNLSGNITYPTTAQPLRTVAIMAPRLAGFGRVGGLLSTPVVNGNNIETIMGVSVNREAYGTNGGFDAFTICFEDTFKAANMGNLTGIAGGFLQQYDSRSLVESNFFRIPTGTTVGLNGGTGMGEGTYYYKVCYEWRDKYGNIYQSAPNTETLTVTTAGANCRVGVRIPSLTISNKHNDTHLENPVILAVYRTEANGTVYKRLYQYEETPTGLLNNYAAAYVYFEDTIPDASLGEPLYTTGGRLENVCPPSTRFAIQHKRRVWLISAEDPTTLWFSQEMIEGETPGFHELLTINMPYDGPITGLGSFDDKLVVFKNDSIWAIFGEGPADNGNNSDISSPVLVTHDVGCIDRRSIVNAMGGIYFQGAKGIYRINSGLQVEFIGAAVESTFGYSTSPVLISSACYVPNMNQVRFALEGGNYTQGSMLVYDTVRNVWSQWDYEDTAIPATIISTAYVDGSFYFATDTKILTNSIKYKDQIGAWANQSYANATYAYVPMTVTTPWIRIGALQGYQRIKRVVGMLESVGAHNINMNLYYDYVEDGYSTIEKWYYHDITAFSKYPLEQIETHVPHQKCQSIKIKFFDDRWLTGPPLEGSDYYNSAGYTISALTLMAGIKRGLNKRGYNNKR